MKLPYLVEAGDISVAIARVVTGRYSRVLRIGLIEDIDWDIQGRRRFQAAKIAHVAVDRGIGNPVEALTDVHVHRSLLNVVEDEWCSVECADLQCAGFAGQPKRRDDELRHRIVDRNDDVYFGMCLHHRLNGSLYLGGPFSAPTLISWTILQFGQFAA